MLSLPVVRTGFQSILQYTCVLIFSQITSNTCPRMVYESVRGRTEGKLESWNGGLAHSGDAPPPAEAKTSPQWPSDKRLG